MSDDHAGVTLGVVGTTADSIAASAPDGVTVRTTESTPTREQTADLLVAVGESALLELARSDPTTPILPVDAGTGVRSVPRHRLASALDTVATREWTSVSQPRIRIDVDGDSTATALLDAMVVTEQPGEISEYTLEAGGESITQVRADGVALATPAGSPGYLSAAGGPVLKTGMAALAVVPVAAFATDLDHWVVPLEAAGASLTLTVERTDAAVLLVADDRDVTSVPPRTPVTVQRADPVEFVTVPESRSCFEPNPR